MRISDWSSDVCSSDLSQPRPAVIAIIQSSPAYGPAIQSIATRRGDALDWQHIFVDRPDMRNRRLQQRACRAGKIWMKAEAAGHRSIGHIPAAERGMQTLFSQCEFLARFIVPRPFARFMAIDEIGRASCRERVCQYV